MENTILSSDIQEFLTMGFDSKTDDFSIERANRNLLEEKNKHLEKKDALEKKIEILQKFSNRSQFSPKEKELYDLLDLTEKRLQKIDMIDEMTVEQIQYYLEQKQIQLEDIRTTLTNVLIAPIDNEYNELFEVFKDETDFQDTIQEDKKNVINNVLENNMKTQQLNAIENYIRIIKDSGQLCSLENIEEKNKAMMKDAYRWYITNLSWLTGAASPYIRRVYMALKDKGKHGKVSISEIQALKSNNIKKDILFLIDYFGLGLTSHMQVNSPIDALKSFVESEEQINSLGYNIDDVIGDLNLTKGIPDSQIKPIPNSKPSKEGEETIEDQELEYNKALDSAKKKLSINLKKLHGLKLFSEFFDKLPKTMSDEIGDKIMHLSDTIRNLYLSIKEEYTSEVGSNYVLYNTILAKHGDTIQDSYVEIESLLQGMIKHPRLEDKIMLLEIIKTLNLYCHEDKAWTDSVNLIFSYWMEESILDAGNQETQNFSNMEYFIGVFNEFIKNIDTIKDKYPALYEAQHKGKYGDDESLHDKVIIFESIRISLNYVHSILQAKNRIQTMSQKAQNQGSTINGDTTLQNFLDTIEQNKHRLPYNDSIIISLHEKGKKAAEQDEYAVELHRIDNSNYLGMLRVNLFNDAIEWERFNQLMVDIKHNRGNQQNITTSKQMNTIINENVDGDVIGIRNIDETFGMLFMLHANGNISINGINEEGLSYIIGEEKYQKFKYLILSNIAECCTLIDKRNIEGTQQNTILGIHEHEDIHRKDPRILYNLNESNEKKGIRNVFYRKEHVRLLHENMMTGYIGRRNAQSTNTPLYACVYPRSADPMIDEPATTIRIDTIPGDFNERRKEMKKLRETHNTNETVIHFQTYVDEFIKDGQSHEGQTITVLETPQPIET